MNNNDQKPSRRVPITAPPTILTHPTTTLFTTTKFDSPMTTMTPLTSTAVTRMTATPLQPEEPVVSAPVFYDNNSWNNKPVNWCQETRIRDIGWERAKVGTSARMPCPHNGENFAVWTCQTGPNLATPVWTPDWPDMSQCQSRWAARIPALVSSLASDHVSSLDYTRSIRSLTIQIFKRLSTRPVELFGGDILPILDVLAKNLDKGKIGNPAHSVQERVVSVIRLLLDSGLLKAWKDIGDNDVIERSIMQKMFRVVDKAGKAAQKYHRHQKQESQIAAPDEEHNRKSEQRNPIVIQMGNSGSGNFSNVLPFRGIYTPALASNLCKFLLSQLYFLLLGIYVSCFA